MHFNKCKRSIFIENWLKKLFFTARGIAYCVREKYTHVNVLSERTDAINEITIFNLYNLCYYERAYIDKLKNVWSSVQYSSK